MQPKEGGRFWDNALRGGGERDEYACYGAYGDSDENLMRTNFEDFKSGQPEDLLRDPNTALTQPLKPLAKIKVRQKGGKRLPPGIEVANRHGMFVSLSLSLSLYHNQWHYCTFFFF